MKIVKFVIIALFIPLCTDATQRTSVSRSATPINSNQTTSSNCETIYYNCMDEVCNKTEELGGRCFCSSEKEKNDKLLEEIETIGNKAQKLATVEVERIQMGAKADYVFSNTKKNEDTKKSNLDLSIFDDKLSSSDTLSSSRKILSGEELYSKMKTECKKKVLDCDFNYLNTVYERKIQNDCKSYTKYIKAKQTEAQTKLSTAEKAQRAALLDSYNDANKYNRGECTLEFKKCMADKSRGGCGTNFENCTDRTVLQNKKYLCERVLDHCIAVRDNVWNDFIIQIEPTLKQAETINENNLLGSCLNDITSCVQTACSENFSGDTNIDACLGNQDMAKQFCKNKITPCQKKLPDIWDYVSAKLASMRVDACTTAVKSCLTDENRCGNDYSQCIGLDTESIRNLCPAEKLTACRKDNQTIALNDEKIDDIISGLMLNIDNLALQQCEAAIDASMTKVCGDAYSCNKLVMDDYIGTRSLQKDKISNMEDGYMIMGIIAWDLIEIKDDGTLDIDAYIKKSKKDQEVKNGESMYKNIEAELRYVSNLSKDAIKTVESDPNVQYCINGRKVNGTTINSNARFPNLMNQRKQIIIQQALRIAKNNYNKKLNELLVEISKESDVSSANSICNQLKYQTMLAPSGSFKSSNEAALYTAATVLLVSAAAAAAIPMIGWIYAAVAATAAAIIGIVAASTQITTAASTVNENKVESWNYRESIITNFNENTRICHKCVRSQNCNKPKQGSNSKWYCKQWAEPVEVCSDISM